MTEKKYTVIKKNHKFMYPYIAMHGHLTKRDRPNRMDNMPRNTIYIRDDLPPDRQRRILLHEYREIRLMEKGLPYHKAHRKSGY
jgi:hypothetical protein